MDEELKRLLYFAESIDNKLSLLLDNLANLSALHAPPGEVKQSEKPEDEKPPYTLAELSERIGVSKRTIYNWVNPKAEKNPLGFGPITRGGRKKYFRRQDVEAYLEGRQAK